MPLFNLDNDTITKLHTKFDEFVQARKIVRENIVSYVADYRSFNGDKQDRREFLEREYMPLAPQMTHLVLDDRTNILWHVQDIAIIMGRDVTAISKLFTRMQNKSGWRSKLIALREDSRSANNNLIHVYHEGIFDLIFDKYEEEYLERFTRPRQGRPSINAREVMRCWKYFKTSQANNELLNFEDDYEDINELPELNVMTWNDIFTLIFRKAFTPRTLTIFPIIFAVSFELARRWNVLIPIFAAASSVTFITCLIILRAGKSRPSLLSNIGAVAMLCAVLWGLGLISDGVIYSPSGSVVSVGSPDHKIRVLPYLERGHKINFRIISDFYDDISEVYYRTNKTGAFKTTGMNNVAYPLLFIESDTQNGELTLEVKYTDINSKDHGPFIFSFDMDKTRFDLSKESLLDEHNPSHWLYLSRINDKCAINLDIDTDFADNIVDRVIYGINTPTPDTVIKVFHGFKNPIRVMPDKNVIFVSSCLVFIDGTSSDVRIAN